MSLTSIDELKVARELKSSLFDNMARKIIFKAMNSLERGRLVIEEGGEITVFGPQKGLDVADFGEGSLTFALGDVVYVSSTEAGQLTNVVPTGETNLIQNIGKIARIDPTTNSTIFVGGAGRTNARGAVA